MIFTSPRPRPTIPRTDLLSYIFDDWEHDWDKPLYISAEDPSLFLTGAQLLDLTKRIGRGLRESANINTGDVVLLSAANSVILPPLMLGIVCAGAMLTGANPTFTETELSYQIRDAGPKAIFATEDTLETVLQSVSSLGLPTSMVHLITLDKDSKKGVRTLGGLTEYGTMNWERLENENGMHNRIVLLNYSSGTTGFPKGCMITTYNIIAQCVQHRMIHDIGRRGLQAQGRKIPEKDTVLAYMPFYHAFAQQTYIINGVRNGDTIYVMPSFSYPALLKYIPAYRVTALDAAPPVTVLLSKDPNVRKTDFSSMHSVLSGAAPLGRETQTQAEDAINAFHNGNIRIQQGWGMTEAVCGICKFALHEHDPDVSGVGYLYPGMTARIVPVDDSSYSQSLDFNQEGEVLLKGPNIFSGYWHKEKETQEAFTQDGWYKTGDIGVMKESGIMHIVDRKKELIKVRGFQVAPAELEHFLLKSPDVDDAAVIGIPSEGSEDPRAYIVPSIHRRSDDLASLRILANDIEVHVATNFAKHKHLSGGIVFVKSIPKSPSGKILRRQLRERAETQVSNDRIWLSKLRNEMQY